MKPNNYILFIEYDGSKFSGWQKQPGRRTVQEELQRAAAKILKEDISFTASGRTDAGVHALCQVVSFSTKQTLKPSAFRLSLNAVLPKDIAVSAVKKAPGGFSARYNAIGKVYEYRIWNHTYRTVWNRHSWHLPQPLDIKLMRKAASFLRGRHDFTAFEASGSGQPGKTVNLKEIKIYRRKGLIVLLFKADRFLYKMVRNITGTLVDVGLGKTKPESLGGILRSRNRSRAGATAPAKGLFIREISLKYEK